MRLIHFVVTIGFFTFSTNSVAQTDAEKKCMPENISLLAPFIPLARERLAVEETFASEYCLRKFEMTVDETRLSFVREVEFDPGTGDADIQHGIILFNVIFDSSTRKIVRVQQILRP